MYKLHKLALIIEGIGWFVSYICIHMNLGEEYMQLDLNKLMEARQEKGASGSN